MSKLPPFRAGLRVVPYHTGDRKAWRIDVLHPTQMADYGPRQVGLDILDDAFQDGERCLTPALDHLNQRIADWPQQPVTIERVRELAAEWA